MKKELTKAEEQIMQAIWRVEKGFAKDVLEVLEEPKPAYNTVLTVIRVLVQKGFVKFKTFGKSNEYYPTISRHDYSLQRVDSLKRKYFNNSNAQFLSFFMKENNLDLEDVNDLMNQIKTKVMNSLTWNFIEINVLIILLYVAYVFVKTSLTLGLRRMFLNAIPFLAILLIGLKSLFDFSEFSVGLSMIQLDPVVIDSSGNQVINYSMSFGLISVYQLGLLVIAPIFLFRLFRVISFFIRNQSEIDGGYRIYHVNGKASFSFFNRIQIAPELIEDDQRIVIEHEKIHANKWHSLDVMIAELMHIVFWVNPVFFWMKRELINLHEFQVDQLMYHKHKVNYLKFLVNYALGFNGPHYLLTSQFYNQLSLKKRIKNMKTSTKIRRWMMLIIPIIGFGALMLQCTKEETKEEAQIQDSELLDKNEPIYDMVDVQPSFKGEEGAMGSYLGDRINYPEAAKEAGVEGTVYVSFVVQSDGAITKAKVMRGVEESLDAEALRVISGMPDWIPGEKEGEKVAVAFTIPIKFVLPPLE